MLAREALKIDAAIWQIAEIYLEDRFLVFRYTNRARIEQLAKLSGGKLRVVDQDSAYLRVPRGSCGTGRDSVPRQISVAATLKWWL